VYITFKLSDVKSASIMDRYSLKPPTPYTFGCMVSFNIVQKCVRGYTPVVLCLEIFLLKIFCIYPALHVYIYIYVCTFNLTFTDKDKMLKFILRFDVSVIACVQKVCVIMLRSAEQFIIVCFCLLSRHTIHTVSLEIEINQRYLKVQFSVI
jgi:hypothetical protein